MGEGQADGGRRAARGLRPARLVAIGVVVLALTAGAIVALAVLNPEPQALRIDYGAFSD